MNVFKIAASELVYKPKSARKPLQPVSVTWHWIHQPIWPSAAVPDGYPGLLLINDTPYMVSGLIDGTANKVEGFRLTKSDGTVYDVDCTHWTCDCPDGTFRQNRPQGCKHSSALVAALKQALTPSEQDDARRYEEAQGDAEAEEVWEERWTLADHDPDAAA